MVLSVICQPVSYTHLDVYKRQDLHNEKHSANSAAFDNIGGGVLAGFSEFLQSRYLLMIGLFIFFYTFIGSFAYFELKNLLVDYDDETRTQIWASMDLVVNCLLYTSRCV